MRSLVFGALLAIIMPRSALADRGAFSLDVGPLVSVLRVPPAVGSGDPVLGSLSGATVGGRYAVRNDFEVTADAVWYQPAPFYNDRTSIPTRNGTFIGQGQSGVGRVGASLGAHYVTGLVWRIRVGAVVGWSRLLYEHADLVDLSDPSSPRSFGLPLSNRARDSMVVGTTAGIEWAASDHVSFAIAPRFEWNFGTGLASVTVPLTVAYSWYML